MELKLQDEMIEDCSAYLSDYSVVPFAQKSPACSLIASADLLDYHETDLERSGIVVVAWAASEIAEAALAVLASSACAQLRNL